MKKILFLFFVLTSCFVVVRPSNTLADIGPTLSPVFNVVAIGDSHVEPRSLFVRSLQGELGPGYIVTGHGRRGWTSGRWIRRGDFSTECRTADIVLISLGGNDIIRRTLPETTRRNINFLTETIPHSVLLIYHMPIPRLVLPREYLGSDGIHMTRQGSLFYARQIAPRLSIDSGLATP